MKIRRIIFRELGPLSKGGDSNIQFIGTFHTHPHEDGTTTAFSDQDIASALETQEKISLVRSGDETYALARTDLTPETVNAESPRCIRSGSA